MRGSGAPNSNAVCASYGTPEAAGRVVVASSSGASRKKRRFRLRSPLVASTPTRGPPTARLPRLLSLGSCRLPAIDRSPARGHMMGKACSLPASRAACGRRQRTAWAGCERRQVRTHKGSATDPDGVQKQPGEPPLVGAAADRHRARAMLPHRCYQFCNIALIALLITSLPLALLRTMTLPRAHQPWKLCPRLQSHHRTFCRL
jgi:hypothetical protein